MKLLKELFLLNEAPLEKITPKVTWRVNGDKSHTLRVDYGNDKVYVHSNKDKRVLEKMLRDRYGPAEFMK